MIEASNIVQLLGNFGFPIVVSIYLLHRFENKLEALENSLHNLSNTVVHNLEKKKGGK
ncbi:MULTISPECIES: YvrJ family protein [unclassified Psychrobacillus]|uniref:YvrJ family protein n=1 Tax=unclassified Psychrobacillus TaxID=2636677 RepID=UPI001469FF61|nr:MULTISPECIES: YvrJ family protein [unclassified Psychrobacillus]MCM3357365.1 YvrJ family protein [Psychrobacillus sp. MER TA 171]NME07632.1 YvrJ family protein [Psychrobacillus sp. BL-248-WT-3]